MYFKKGSIIAILFFAFSCISIYFIDKPLALYLHEHGFNNWFALSIITEYGIPAFIAFCIIFLCYVPTHPTLSQRLLFLVYAIIIISFTELARIKLGVLFARSWPLAWSGSGVYGSLIPGNQFGFHFLESSNWKGAFPSGHSMAITSICCTMYLIYNRYLVLWIIPTILMQISLILLNYHYLSDCLAGIGLGVLISYYGFFIRNLYITNSLMLNRSGHPRI